MFGPDAPGYGTRMPEWMLLYAERLAWSLTFALAMLAAILTCWVMWPLVWYSLMG